MRIHSTIAAIGLGLASLAGFAQKGPELTARELFYVPAATAAPPAGKKVVAARPPAPRPPQAKQQAAKATPAPPAVPEAEVVTIENAAYEGPRPLGLRYSVLRMSRNGSSEVAPDSTFRSGDSVGISVQANEPAYLYVVARGSSGKWQVMFPNKEFQAGDNFIEGGRTYQLPTNDVFWTFDEHKGTEKMVIVLSRQEVPDLEKLIYELTQPAKPVEKAKPTATPAPKEKPMMIASAIDDDLVGRLRSEMLSRDLIIEKVSKKEEALYAVEPSGRRDARLVIDVELKHE